ncbi:hypothetical protein HELRODRAFT_149122, partial [Helobdella robusta]|uniref:PH domain-containing protein n=1 Tax=Helobdella robusta TaxID=6412 RepID=T1EKC4_HELRO
QELEEMNLVQLYVFVARCIAYPFSAKYRYDIIHKPPKLTNLQLMLARERFQSFLNGDLKLSTDEAFTTNIAKFNDVILKREEVTNVVNGPGWTMTDFSDLFKKEITQYVARLPEIKGLSKSTLIDNWMNKFEFLFKGESDNKKVFVHLNTVLKCITTKMNKDQLFELFQKILGIKKQQHWTLYKLLQVDNTDEQAAQVRRELDYRMNEVKERQKKADGNTEMDSCYIEELKLSIESLKASLQNVPVFKDENNKELSKFKMVSEDETIEKNDLVLSFKVQVVIKGLQGFVEDKKDKLIFCTFEMDGCDKLSTNRVDPSNMSWDDQADFLTSSPLPNVRIRLCRESSGVFNINDRELARVDLLLKLSNTKATEEWMEMQQVYKKDPVSKNVLKIKLLTHVEKPPNVKHFGYLFALGKTIWKKWKKRYFLLIQACVSQFTFVLCSYRENKTQPDAVLPLHGFIVDFCGGVPGTDLSNLYLVLTKQGFDEIILTSSSNESDLMPWLDAIYRATGQPFKPQLPTEADKQDTAVYRSESQRIKRKKLQVMVDACPSKFDHEELFVTLQRKTIEYRLSDSDICSSGWLSADQIYVLDEYCARYGVRVFTRHLSYIEILMDHAYSNISIDPSLLYQKFAFCMAHVHGNKLDQTYAATIDEKKKFLIVAIKLKDFLEYQFIHFRYTTCFPFGRPKDSLKICLSLYESDTKHSVDPISAEKIVDELKRCISNSTYFDYIHVAQLCGIEEALFSTNFERNRTSFLALAEHCIQIQQQIFWFHADVRIAFVSYKDILTENGELLWSLFILDFHQFTDKHPLTELLWNLFSLFNLLNQYFSSQSYLNQRESHKELCKIFAPIVLHYLESMHQSIVYSLRLNFDRETWKPL